MEGNKKTFKLKFYPLPFIIFSVLVVVLSCILIAFPPVVTTDNQLSIEMLNKYDFSEYENLMIVAHPDDETLWAGNELLENDYVVVCLTNGNNKKRVEEFSNAMSFSDDLGIILSYPDLNYSLIQNKWEDVEPFIKEDLMLLINWKSWDKVVTHNPDGEYGHNHHKKTSKYTLTVCIESHKLNNLYYFGKYIEKDDLKTVVVTLSNAQNIKKSKMIDLYLGTQKHSVNLFKYLSKYELLIKASDWKFTGVI